MSLMAFKVQVDQALLQEPESARKVVEHIDLGGHGVPKQLSKASVFTGDGKNKEGITFN